MISLLTFNRAYKPLKAIHYPCYLGRLDPIQMTSPFHFIPHQIKIPENAQYLRDGRYADTQEGGQFFGGSLLTSQQG